MHDLGDGLVNAGLRDPVLDVDRLSVSYTSCVQLFADLTAVGARNAVSQRTKGLTSRERFLTMEKRLNDTAGITLDLELVYGHCWGGEPRNDPANFKIDASKIPIRHK